MLTDEIKHTGRVAAVAEGRLTVEVLVGEACGACASRRACSLWRSQSRTIEIAAADAASFAAGEQVEVSVRRRTGLAAVALGYVVPLAVLVAALAGCVAAGLSEGAAAAGAIAGVALYYGLLCLLRRRIAQRVSFGVSKLPE